MRGDEHRTERRKRFSPVADRIEDVLREIRFFAKKNDFDRQIIGAGIAQTSAGILANGGPAPSRFEEN